MQRTYGYSPSLEQIASRLLALPGPIAVVGITGYGGSGKTTLAQELGKRLHAPAISIDEFGTPDVFRRSDAWAGFDRARLIRQVLAPVAAGTLLTRYDRCDDWESWQSVSVQVVVDRYLIVEGVGLFHPDLLPYLDYRVWMDVPLKDATARRATREFALGRNSLGLWTDLWEPNEEDFERRFAPRAHAHLFVRPDTTDRLTADR